MKLLRTAVLLPFMVLACSDDDVKNEPPKNTGTFAYGTVTGLHYRAGSDEGDTNGAGEFRYADGDTVTFSVGGVVLGSATGAARISPLDLFGGQLPPTEQALAKELERVGDVTPLEQAINVGMFLLAIDADNDVANGLDVTAAVPVLNDRTLVFDDSTRIFAQQHLIPMLVETAIGHVDVSPARAAAHLYRSVDAQLAATPRTTHSEDAGADGSTERSETHTFNERGQHTLVVVTDGAGDVVSRTETAFDARGRVTTRIVRTAPTSPGVFDNEHTTTMTYDAALGLVVEETQEARTGGVVQQRTVTTYMRNTYGSAVLEETETDTNGDGTVDTLRRVTRDFDSSNRPTLVTTTAYSDFGETAVSRERVSTSYDAAGNEADRLYEYDGDADGTYEVTTRTLTTYDAARRATNVRVEQDDPLSVYDEVTVNTYDSAGLLTRIVSETDSGADGGVEYLTTTDLTYDGNRHLTREFEDGVNGGLIHNLRTTNYVYDAAGNLTSKELVINQNSQANPAPDSIERWTYTHDAAGYELTMLHQRDTNADGTFNEQVSTASTYSATPDPIGYVFGAEGY